MDLTTHESSLPVETVIRKEVNETMNDVVQIAKTSNSKQLSLSKKLAEIMRLINNVRQRLEDFSIDRRTEVSQMQWMTLEKFKSSPKVPTKPVKFWQRSLFARIYFINKDLDEIFQNIMKSSSKLMFCNNGTSSENIENVKFGNNPKSATTKRSSQLSAVSLRGNSTKASKVVPSISIIDEAGSASLDDIGFIQQSFTDLIKAKIEFDSQFLHFNSTLSKNCFYEDFLYLYKICTKSDIILGETSLSIDKQKSVSSSNTKIKRKRLSNNLKNKSRKRQLRKSVRSAFLDDSSEVQVIRNFRRRETT
ncbi:PREDICTED: uncharacterized protein LOC105359560 [Ceratosolen solmsi marchali]|uniref:Uncharacterized protein LOC105359560 n=1 Tax=Ceratosolen solmsi marchali TaxID=326594 RepID=A0AAJ6VK35_9HYME|nr:PREDICTED: uncharacterized protein LOC105359560 [Ceratosolen solmsi marchali]